jgi:hypothetical protein
MERRQRELAEHRATLDYHDVDPDAVGRALVGAGLSWNVHPATSRRRPIRSSRMIRIDFERRRLP